MLVVALCLISCSKNPFSEDDSVNVRLSFVLSQTAGDYMQTKSSGSKIYDIFYQKVSSGELVAPSYNLTFTETTTGVSYEVNGKWSSDDVISLKKGEYTISGISTADGDNIQNKCSISISDKIKVDGTESSISLSATYDCSLIIFNNPEVSSVANYNGINTTSLFSFPSVSDHCYYAFVNNTIYDVKHQDSAYLLITYTDGTSKRINTGSIAFEIGKYYYINEIEEDLKTLLSYNLGEMEDGMEKDDITNLSQSETANCYIVNKAGTYKFNAAVKGNGTESVGTPAKATVLWETFNSSVKPSAGDLVSNVSFSDGYITFSTTGKAGNALISVKDESDTILWSWHIWCTGYTPLTDYDIYTAHPETKVMDRNLGALSSTPGNYLTIGFYYQWGRKDPLPSSSSITEYTMMATMPESVFSTTSCTQATGNMNYAVQHPTIFVSENINYDWMYTANGTLWSSAKTIYDPCPPGWKVPEASLYSGFVATSDYTRDSENKGVSFGTSVSTPATFFPCNGTIGGKAVNSVGEFTESCHYWTCDIYTDSAYSKRFCIYKDSAPSTSYLSFRSHGFPVRCIKE